jgi:O-glycosyl hydrolase
MKKTIPQRLLLSAAAMLCTVLSAQSPILDAEISLTPTASNGSPFNGGVFEGWGTSLCWWANRVGYSDKLTDAAVDAFFDPDKGLGLNIVRYNIGGGDDPSHRHITRSDSNMPGFAQPVPSPVPGAIEVDDDGIAIYDYDWDRDRNQMNVLTKILARNPDTLVEAFSNAPPYFMTWSGCSSGGRGEHKDNNLRPEYVAPFAEFLADVVKHFRDDLHIRLNSIDPFNEPSSGFWGAFSNKQEGCDIKDNKLKSEVILALDKALRRRGVRDGILIAVADETSMDLSIDTYRALSPDAKKAVGRINTHSYSGSRRTDLRKLAAGENKHLWMSEVDGNSTIGGQAAGDMGGPLWLAKRIIEDMNGMRPSAWVLWQVIDRHRSDFNAAERANTSLAGSYWGLGIADHFEEKLLLGKRYYAFGQFSRYIRPGDRIIASSPYTLAAYNSESGRIAIVAVNDSGTERPVKFDLRAFDRIPADSAKVIRTSGPVNSGENWNENIPEVPIRLKTLAVRLAPFSITTFVIGKPR